MTVWFLMHFGGSDRFATPKSQYTQTYPIDILPELFKDKKNKTKTE